VYLGAYGFGTFRETFVFFERTFLVKALVLYFWKDGSLFRPAFIRVIRREGTIFFFFTGGFLRVVATIAPCYYRLLFSEPIIKR
jgi:hypothetical protein